MHRCYVSYKTEDSLYALKVLCLVPGAFIKPDARLVCYEDDVVLEDIREKILEGSDITIHLIGACSAERLGHDEQRFIKRELQVSLCKAKEGLRSGVLGIVLPEAFEAVFKGTYLCPECGEPHERIVIDDSTATAEFSRNYRCGCRGESGYCMLVPWDDFITEPDKYIERAFIRRFGPAAHNVVIPRTKCKMPLAYGWLKGGKDAREG